MSNADDPILLGLRTALATARHELLTAEGDSVTVALEVDSYAARRLCALVSAELEPRGKGTHIYVPGVTDPADFIHLILGLAWRGVSRESVSQMIATLNGPS